jgi:transposase
MLLGLGLNRGGVMAWKSGQSYSADLRSRVLAAVDGGLPARAAAERFRVSVSYIYKALARRTATGETEARPQRNHQTLKLAAHHDVIAAEVVRRPDATLNELRAWLLATHGVAASLGLMHRTLARLGLTLKKSRSGPRSRSGPSLPSSAPFGGPGRTG